MPPSAAAGSEGSKALVSRMLREVLVGREDPEGFFALCLSALGHQETRSQFLSHIQPLSTANSSLHSILTSIYKDYFSKVIIALVNTRVSLQSGSKSQVKEHI